MLLQLRWITQETNLHINLLVPKALRNACFNFLPLIMDKSIRVMTDNMFCTFYINKQGGTSPWSSVHWSCEAVELVHSSSDTMPPPRHSEHCNQCHQQTLLTGLWMGAKLSSVLQCIPKMGSAGGGSLHHLQEQEVFSFLLKMGSGMQLFGGQKNDLLYAFPPTPLTQDLS